MAQGEALNRQRDQFGRYIKVSTSITQKETTTSSDPPLVDIKVTNPITYFKLWLSKFFKNSEMTLTIKLKPATIISIAIALAILLTGTGFSVFYFLLPH